MWIPPRLELPPPAPARRAATGRIHDRPPESPDSQPLRARRTSGTPPESPGRSESAQRGDFLDNRQCLRHERGGLIQGRFGFAGSRRMQQSFALRSSWNSYFSLRDGRRWPARPSLSGWLRIEVAIEDDAVQAVAQQTVVPMRLGEPIDIARNRLDVAANAVPGGHRPPARRSGSPGSSGPDCWPPPWPIRWTLLRPSTDRPWNLWHRLPAPPCWPAPAGDRRGCRRFWRAQCPRDPACRRAVDRPSCGSAHFDEGVGAQRCHLPFRANQQSTRAAPI